MHERRDDVVRDRPGAEDGDHLRLRRSRAAVLRLARAAVRGDVGMLRRDLHVTRAQKIALIELANGVQRGWNWPKGQARTAWIRMMNRLVAAGLARTVATQRREEYAITDAGQAEAKLLEGGTEWHAAAIVKPR